MSEEHILLVLTDIETGKLLERAALTPAGYRISLAGERESALKVIKSDLPEVVLLDERLEGGDSFEFAKYLFESHATIPVVLILEPDSKFSNVEAFRKGFIDSLQAPFHARDVQQVVERAISHKKKLEQLIQIEAKRNTKNLRSRVNGLETIQKVGRQVTALLDLGDVLATVVGAAVDLTGAERGSLLLLDEHTGELYMRASRNSQDEFSQTSHLPVKNSLISQVLRTGEPLLINEEKPRKIKTAYLVYTLMYVPLMVKERVIGVLEVYNRQTKKPFTEYHSIMVSALADYAAIAIENANLYSRTERERNQLETILTKIEEGVIVVDNDQRVMLINRMALLAFNVEDGPVIGKRIQEIIYHPELLEIFDQAGNAVSSRTEITLEDGRVFNAQLTRIPDIGLALTMQDITHLKELDRIKSDFVNTVSHDLRSPLTAILGYVELLERVGPINSQQKEFIHRVQISVHNITSLINDLLDLGRIEAGFDTRNEIVPIETIIEYAVDGLKGRAQEKAQELYIDTHADLPEVLGNPVRLRQLLNNLISNSIKYTSEGGWIKVRARAEKGQIILEISDNGFGIPPADQPYIFDKFYRASNVPLDSPGTGLGLAIVKSIVDSHNGRIWVESTQGEGTTFTVVLPVVDRKL
jgi:two-component system phosphate regulon sensor histidine kinase PhoR